MASPLVHEWLYATVPIDNPQGESGTGFLVFRATDTDQGRVFLVTNKHVVARNPVLRASVSHVTCHFNTKKADGTTGTVYGAIQLANPDGSQRVRQHPDPDTDVLAIEVTDVIEVNRQIQKRWARYDLFADAAKRRELDITVGEEVLTIGYPLGLRQGDTNFPLVRQGLIATKIGELLRDKVPVSGGGFRDRALRAFLIDGAIVPGSSGSPVVLKPVVGRFVGSAIAIGPGPMVLLGIVAETMYAPVQFGPDTIPSFAGLGLVFEVETIRETIELFFPQG